MNRCREVRWWDVRRRDVRDAISFGSLIGLSIWGVIALTIPSSTQTLSPSISQTVSGSCAGDLSGTYPTCTVAKINGATPAAVATSGSASDLGTGTLLAARMPAHTGDVTSTVGSVGLVIGVTRVTSAMLNSDVFSSAHSWAGQQTFTAPILGAATATSLTLSGALKLPTTTVASLPTCNAGALGTKYAVTDALTPVALASVVGGGAVVLSVFCNGTAWVVN
jgi:hypothetical protein